MTLSRRWSEGADLVLCMALTQARTADIPLMAAASGFDAVYVDLEHTPISLETASTLCIAARGAGIVPLVRVPSQHSDMLTRALDVGASGLIVPHVESPDQAKRIVDACRFPPQGSRSIIGTNPVTGYRPMAISAGVDLIAAETFICAMLESPSAIETAADIADVDGIDLLLVGAYDLSAEMGILGDFRDAKFLSALEQVARACRSSEKMFGIAGISEVALITDLVQSGLRFVSAGTDAGFLMEAARQRVSILRDVPIPTLGATEP
jgi:4-hydroxy-2-oxoheptanedioate aldolase